MSETLRDLVVSLSLQTDNFTRNIKSVNKQIQEAESKFRLAAAGIEGFEKTKESVEGLKSATGYIKRELSNRLHMRKCPDLQFIADDSIEYGAQISHLLEKLEED